MLKLSCDFAARHPVVYANEVKIQWHGIINTCCTVRIPVQLQQ
jgi:hypothetical protein